MKSKFNWEEIQKSYNSGMSQSQIMTAYSMSSRTMFNAVKNGIFKSRTRSEANKIHRANNPRSAESRAIHGAKISATVTAKVEAGEWHTSLAKRMHINYNGVDLHGTWELAYAKFLDANNVKWQRNKESFVYVFENKERRYTPDFYLIDENVYIEIKGYKTEKDKAKWSQFPPSKKLIVLMKQELKEMKAI